tara:strand:+ start:69 stop:263 length:195 start_codon:yes stop_codon:yes gene_type:complete
MVSGKQKIVDTILLKTPKVIPNKLWDEVQHKLLDNLRVRSNEKTYHSLLDNIIYCKSCGGEVKY